MKLVIPVALRIYFISKNKNIPAYMQESNRTLLIYPESRDYLELIRFTV